MPTQQLASLIAIMVSSAMIVLYYINNKQNKAETCSHELNMMIGVYSSL